MPPRSWLSVNLDAVRANYSYLCQLSTTRTITGAAVKADGYGLGMCEVSDVLYDEGCRHFFVASLEEAVRLRTAFRTHNRPEAEIIVFDGLRPSEGADYAEYGLTAMLNCPSQIDMLTSPDSATQRIMVHIDTGMSRLGLSDADAQRYCDRVAGLEGLCGVMSHLANADMPDHPFNKTQLNSFEAFCNSLQQTRGQPVIRSLANTGGIMMGADFHFELTRPGIGLTGLMPDDSLPAAALSPALRWDTAILQIRDVPEGHPVGYGSSFVTDRPMRLATLGAGYADGYPRSQTWQTPTSACVDIAGYQVPLVGRVSMDVMVADVTEIPPARLEAASSACLLGSHYSVSQLARDTGTIGYEILTGIGGRTIRHYDGGGDMTTYKTDPAQDRRSQ